MSAIENQVNSVNIVNMVFDTTVGWAANDFVIPAGIWAKDTILGTLKLGDGAKLYSELPITVNAVLTPEQRNLLDKLFTTSDGGLTYQLKAGVNIPNAPILADATGKLRAEALPDFVFNTVKVVPTIGDRDALGVEYHKSAILVIDATADLTVEKGGAMYCWYDPDGTGALPESWNKIQEFSEMDVVIDWAEQLKDHFKFRGAGANTLDDIADGALYAKATKAQLQKLDGIETLADVTDKDNVRAAGAMMTADTYLPVAMGAADLKAAMVAGVHNATV